MAVKMWSMGLVAVLSAVIVAIASPAVSASDDGLLAGYENGDREFKKFEIGNITVYFHQRMIDEAIVEKDFIVYQFDRKSKELLEKGMHWRSGLPEHVTPAITQEEAERMVKGEIQFTRLYIISPESDVFPLKPTPDNPCWVVRSLDDDKLVVTIVDAVEGTVLGNGVPPPYTGFSLSGPWYFGPCSGTWTSWYQNAEYWFNTIGYPTEAVQWPVGEKVRSHVQSCSTAMFYELAHGGSSSFSSGCTDGTYAYEIENWISDYTKMPFAFIGSCGGLCYVGSGSLSYEFRKGSMENTATVGYCNMAEPECDGAWSNSVSWQNALFDYMNQGYTVKAAFDQAIADYPMCLDCMRFCGDENFGVVPVVKRNWEPTLDDGYVTPEAGNIETVFAYHVIYHDIDGDEPSTAHVCIDGDPHEMYLQPPGDSLYFCETTLSAGIHDYYFYFENVCGTSRLPASDTFVGPDILGADLQCSLWVEPDTAMIGHNVYLYMIGKNTGNAYADSVTPHISIQGGGSVMPMSGPDPSYANIQGGTDTVFHWVYAAEDTGWVRWIGYAFGEDRTSGSVLTSPEDTSNQTVILPTEFIRADADGDMDVEMSDAVFVLRWLYVPGSPDPYCMDAADSNDDSEIEMSDVVFTLRYLYVPESPEPPEPGPETCGPDPTPDTLGCIDHPCMLGRTPRSRR